MSKHWLKMTQYLIFFLTILGLSLTSVEALADTYTVYVDNIKNDSGVVRISLYNSPSTYKTRSKEQSFRVGVIPIKNHRAVWRLSNIPSGDYAVLFYHDEDNSNAFKKNFIGIPIDGYGYSGSASKTSVPPYDNAKFRFDPQHKSVTVHMLYW